MSAYLLFYLIIITAIGALFSGVYLLGGLGWALVAFSVALLGLAFQFSRGLKLDE